MRGIWDENGQRLIFPFMKYEVTFSSLFILYFLKGMSHQVCDQVWGSAAECRLLLLERQMHSVARLCHVVVTSTSCSSLVHVLQG